MIKREENIFTHPKEFSQNEVSHIIENLPVAIAVVDETRKLILANKMAHMFTNKADNQLTGLVIGEAFGCIHHEDSPEKDGSGENCLQCKLRTTVHDTLKNGKDHFQIETAMTFKSIGRRHLKISTQPLEVKQGRAVLLSIEDITTAKNYVRAKSEIEKLTAVVQTAGAICHEINQPLMAVSGFSELLMDDVRHGQIQEENVKEIRDQAERLAKITNKLMAITKYKK
nr:histidine kinase dimerization/phospho-acceptor domain-containing protein [uncultured Desulfobacter sp.]